MKTIITALVAMAISMNASASHKHTAVCPVNCPEAIVAVKPAAKSYDQKVADLKLAAEDRVSMLNYRQTMQNTLKAVEMQKHVNAIENLEAENNYNSLMAALLQNLEQEKLEDRLEDAAAANRFEQLMAQTLSNIAGK